MFVLELQLFRLIADTRAAREKNGVYIPHDRFAQEEMEKKVFFFFIANYFCILLEKKVTSCSY